MTPAIECVVRVPLLRRILCRLEGYLSLCEPFVERHVDAIADIVMTLILAVGCGILFGIVPMLVIFTIRLIIHLL